MTRMYNAAYLMSFKLVVVEKKFIELLILRTMKYETIQHEKPRHTLTVYDKAVSPGKSSKWGNIVEIVLRQKNACDSCTYPCLLHQAPTEPSYAHE